MKRFLILLVLVVGIMLLFIGSYAYSQDSAFQPDEFVGVDECSACHRGVARDHDTTPHTLTLGEPDAALADFSQDAPFDEDDVALVVGAGRYMQAYLTEVGENDYQILPAIWDTVAASWLPYEGDTDWEQSCAGCHTTGFNVETASWVDPGVQCEACHGPGGGHVNFADEMPRSPDDAEVQAVRDQIVLSPDPQICGACHAQGAAESHPFPVGYLPGDDLSAHFTLVAPDDADHWWATGHAQDKYMQYNEWLLSGHAGALDNLKEIEGADPACLSCHSEDYRYGQTIIAAHDDGDWEGVPPDVTVENAQFGVTCITCHDPHLSAEDSIQPFSLTDTPYNQCVACHNDNEITEGIHKPTQEMFEGQSVAAELEAVVEPVPSAHFTADDGPDCLTCHMQRIPVEDSPGGRATHTMQVVMPGENVEGLESACAGCHAEQASGASMQALIDNTQAGIAARLEVAQAAVTDETPIWAVQALDFIEGDGSQGIHNFVYTSRLLSAAEMELGLGSADTETIMLPDVLLEAAAEREDAAVAATDTVEEEGLAPVALAIMTLAVLLILTAAYFFLGRGQAYE